MNLRGLKLFKEWPIQWVTLTHGVWMCNMSFLDSWFIGHMVMRTLNFPTYMAIFFSGCSALLWGLRGSDPWLRGWYKWNIHATLGSRLARAAQFTAPWPRSSRTNPAPLFTFVRHRVDEWLLFVNTSCSTHCHMWAREEELPFQGSTNSFIVYTVFHI